MINDDNGFGNHHLIYKLLHPSIHHSFIHSIIRVSEVQAKTQRKKCDHSEEPM